MHWISQVQLLPLDRWQDFESLCHEVFRAEWNDFHAQKHGRPGYRQQGVDVYGRSSYSNGYAGVQCKCRDLLVRSDLTQSQLLDEVSKAKKFQPPLKQFTVATSLPRNPTHQQWARDITERHNRKGLFSVHVLSWDDIKDMLARFPHITKRYYPHLFPQDASAPTQAPALPMAPQQVDATLARRSRARKTAASPLILPPHTHLALGIIATSPVPVVENWLRQFFPAIEWSKEIPALHKANAITVENSLIAVRKPVAVSFFDNAGDRNQFLQKWLGVLEPLSSHPDTAFFLSALYMKDGKLRDAIRTLVDVAYTLEPGSWNETYRTTLASCDTPKVFRSLQPKERVEFLNAIGVCHARSPKPLDAIPYFHRLRAYSARIRNQWGIGQSFINAGVAYLDAGNVDSAERALLRATRHAREHKDFVLLGRALHNLASLTVQRDPDCAEKLLSDSVAAKKKARDNPSDVSTLFCRGIIAAHRGDHRAAYRWFARAEQAAAKTDQRDARCTALHNMGKARLDAGSAREALRFFQAAHKLAKEEGFYHHLVRTVGSEAYARSLLRQYDRAASLFREHADLLLKSYRYEDAAIALHDMAVMLSRAGDATAPAAFHNAIQFAVKYNVQEWLYHCHRDQALLHAERRNPATALRVLRRSIATVSRKANHVIAARLQEDVIHVLLEYNRSPDKIIAAFADALSAWQTAELPEKTCHLYEWLYTWEWSVGRHREAIASLRDLARFASRHRLYVFQSRALDQIGVCLQELGSYRQAEAAHRESIALARRAKLSAPLENALNNLGELLRKTDRPREALKPLLQAESLATASKNDEAAVGIAHNRALALFASGERASARRLLRSCRDRAERNQWHHESVRSLHGLANFAWESKQPAKAERLYRQALRQAVCHDVTDQLWQLALNLGNALRHRKRLKEALRHFRLAAQTCDDTLALPRCYMQIAACETDLGMRKTAQHDWHRCRDLAVAANDRETVAIASASLAEGYADTGAFDQAHTDMETAFRHEDNPSDRGHLLLDHLHILLAARRHKEATKVFNRLRTMARKESALADVLIDAHVAVADYMWAEGKKPMEALKAFVAALHDAYSVGIERAMEIGVHMGKVLMSIPVADRPARLDRYEERLITWLHRMSKKRLSPIALRALLWPVRVTKKLAQFPKEGATLSASQISELIGEEIGIRKPQSA